MEDLQGFLQNATVSIQGRKKTMDSHYDAVVQSDASLKGLNGESTGIFCLYTGYGGSSAAELLKKLFVPKLTKEPTYAEDLEKALAATYEAMHKDIRSSWIASQKDGASLLSCAVRDGHIYLFSSGNSGAVLCRAEGEVESFITTSPRIDESNAPEVKVVGLDWEDEFFILGCRGFWSKISPAQAVGMTRVSLKKFNDVNHAAQKLSYAAYVNGSSSNISVSIVILNQEIAMGNTSRGTKFLAKFRRKPAKGNSTESQSSVASSPTSPVVYSPSAFHKTGAKKGLVKGSGVSTPTNAGNSQPISRQISGLSEGTAPSRSEDMDHDVDFLHQKMAAASAQRDFEMAAKLRDRIGLVEDMNRLVAEMKFEEAAKIRDKLNKMN